MTRQIDDTYVLVSKSEPAVTETGDIMWWLFIAFKIANSSSWDLGYKSINYGLMITVYQNDTRYLPFE